MPMWASGLPAGLCGRDAYGVRPDSKIWRDAYTGQEHRADGKYSGYVPGLACSRHGGPSIQEVAHKGDPCIFCGTPHDDIEPGACPGRLSEIDLDKLNNQEGQ